MAISSAVSSIKALSSKELRNFGGELGKSLKENETTAMLTSLADTLSPDSKKRALIDAVSTMPAKDKKELVGAIGGPGPETRDRLWRIAVLAFAIVMVGSFLFLATGIFFNQPEKPIVSAEVLLSIFTAAVGFFAGLFAPSPGSS